MNLSKGKELFQIKKIHCDPYKFLKFALEPRSICLTVGRGSYSKKWYVP